MSAVSNTFSSQNILAALNSYVVTSEQDFFKKFGWGKAKMVGTDENAYSEDKPISAFDIGDCITLFAIEKKNNKNEAMISWHIGNGSSVKDLVSELKGYNYSNPYDLYIIGGISDTTEGEGCLLDNIHKAIKIIFNQSSKIKLELVNLNAKTGLDFVSASLQLDGTLTFCRHNTRHL